MSTAPLGATNDSCLPATPIYPLSGFERVRTLFSCFAKADVVLICSLSLLLYPAFRLAHLQLRFDFVDITTAYWFGTAASGTFVAVVFAVIGLPLSKTLLPFISRASEHKGFLVIWLALACVMFSLLGFWLGLTVTIDALAVGELVERTRGTLKSKLLDIFIPCAYMFLGVILVFAFDHAIAGIRNPEAYDAVLNRADWILFHIDVSALAHWSFTHVPLPFFHALEIAYFGLYSRVAGALIVLAILKGRRQSIAMVRTILICYVLALVCYATIPAKGPYAECAIHASTFPRSLKSFATQEMLTQRVRMLWAHKPAAQVSRVDVFDYFISFPSLHIALPLIAIWSLRGYKWIARVYLTIYALLLVPAVVFLEWHYVVDVVGGCVVALLAIWISERISPPDPIDATARAIREMA